MPLPVTVVIPTYNQPGLLRETIETVLRQTARPAEIIVVDDGSSDPPPELPGVRTIVQNNAGQAAARNTGIRAAQTEWIALLDHDDLWDPRKLELQWNVVERYPAAGMIFSDWSIFEGATTRHTSALFARGDLELTPHVREIREAYRIARRDPVEETAYCPNAPFRRALVQYGPFVLTSTLLVRRDLVSACGGFDAQMRRTDDWDLWLRLAALGTSAAVVEKPLVRYRLHGSNTSADLVESARWIAHMVLKAGKTRAAYPPEMHAFWERALPAYVHRGARVAFASGRFDAAAALYALLSEYAPHLRIARAGQTMAAILNTKIGHAAYRVMRRLKNTF